MELRSPLKLALGGILLVTFQTLNFFGLFRSLDWLHTNNLLLFNLLENSAFQKTLLFAGFGMCALGLYETWKKTPAGDSAGRPPQPNIHPPPSSTTHGDRSHNFSGTISSVTINESPKQPKDEQSSLQKPNSLFRPT
jgi:hypothetical protein